MAVLYIVTPAKAVNQLPLNIAMPAKADNHLPSDIVMLSKADNHLPPNIVMPAKAGIHVSIWPLDYREGVNSALVARAARRHLPR